LNLYAVPAALT